LRARHWWPHRCGLSGGVAVLRVGGGLYRLVAVGNRPNNVEYSTRVLGYIYIIYSSIYVLVLRIYIVCMIIILH
jgi:hypothetical protein